MESADASAELNETNSRASFRDIALESQERWRALKNKPYKEFSQAIDIPNAVSGRLLRIVLANLPPYIPDNLKVSLTDNHPEPIIAAGVLPDRRLFAPPSEFILEHPLPPTIETDEKESWEIGMTLLNEIATDTLAQDILRQMGKTRMSASGVRWFAPLTELLRITNPVRKAYASGLKQAENIFGGKEKFQRFRQELIITALSGDQSGVDSQLKTLDLESLDAFAVEIGKQAKRYGREGMETIGKVFGERLMFSFGGALMSEAFPGVINLPLAHALPASVNLAVAGYVIAGLKAGIENPAIAALNLVFLAFNSYWALKPAYGIPNAVLHELCHYLGQGTNHNGLISIERSRL